MEMVSRKQHPLPLQPPAEASDRIRQLVTIVKKRSPQQAVAEDNAELLRFFVPRRRQVFRLN